MASKGTHIFVSVSVYKLHAAESVYDCQVLLDLKREQPNQREDQTLFFDKISQKREIFLQSGTLRQKNYLNIILNFNKILFSALRQKLVFSNLQLSFNFKNFKP